MEFGFVHVPAGPPQDSAALIRLAEQTGYHWAWVPDQTFFHDPYAILTIAARNTSTIKLAVGITNPYTRHPAMTARAAATVDEIAGGRLVLGLGAGNQRELVRPLGYGAEAPSRACREALEIMRAYWSGESVTIKGVDFQVLGVKMEVTARSDIPVFIGGRGPRILALAGREADGAILSLAGLDNAAKLVAEGARRANRDPASLYYVAWGECALLDVESDMTEYRIRLGHVLGRAPIAGLRVMGLSDDEISRLKSAFEEGGPSQAAAHVTDEILSRHLIYGTSGECIAALKSLEARGVHSFAYLIKQVAFEEVKMALEAFSQNVIARY